MANTREIRNRMESIRNTEKITNAMYMIASNKLQHARADLERTRPYFLAMRDEIRRILRMKDDVQSRYFYPSVESEVSDGIYGLLVITADKGLAGAYNMNVFKETQRLLGEHPQSKLYVVGSYGRAYFSRHDIPIEQSFLYTAQNPTMQRAREISGILLDRFDAGELDKIFVIYTDMKNSLNEEAISTRLLPFHRYPFTTPSPDDDPEEYKRLNFEFFPSITQVLDQMMRSYVTGFIYSTLVDSFCSEQNARMEAMKAANDNAEKLISELSIQYNRVRQAAITQEITEVSAGAKAQQRRRRRVNTQGAHEKGA